MKKKWLIILGLTLVLIFVCGLTACNGGSEAETPQGETYTWTYDRPFAGIPDEDMHIDGKLDETAWQNKNYLSQTIHGISWQVTTHFTEKGLYVAVKAVDDNMIYNSRYTSRSAFYVYLCKTGTQTYDINSLLYHSGRCFQFQLDAYYCRSKDRIPYYYEAVVDGKLNSETTCTMTGELFITWEDMYYTEEELGKKGYPDDIQMYVNYTGEPTEVLGSCLWREETYLHFNENGYMGEPEDQHWGSIENGLSATDQWTQNENGNLQTKAGRTQIIWLKEAYAKNFMFEAELRPINEPIYLRGDFVSGRFGLINETAGGNYTIYSADARSAPSVLQLQTCRQIDSFHWQNQIGLYSNAFASGIAEGSITLRVIKQDDMFYYFYGDTYWKSERVSTIGDEVYSGIFTSQSVEILGYKFENYDNDESALKEKLSEYVWFVNVPGVSTYGTVEASEYAVAKGESVTVSFLPSSRGVLTAIRQNGVDKYDEIVQAMNDKCEYTFTPEQDTTFEATFSAFDSDALVRTVVAFNDGTALVRDGSYEISGENNKLLFYTGTANSSGYVIVYLPKAGNYTVDGKKFEVNGNYDLSASFGEHLDYETKFELNDQTTSADGNIYGEPESVAENQSFTLKIGDVIEKNYGAVIVNGISVNGGEMGYNKETGNYYISGSTNAYFKDTVGSDYSLNITISASNIGHKNNDLAAVVLTNGKYVIVFKAHLENANCLFIATGSGTDTSVAGREIVLTGFTFTNRSEPTASQANGSFELNFKLVKSGNSIYLFSNDGVLRAYLNENGVNLVNSSVVQWSAGQIDAVNADVATFMKNAEQTAMAARTYEINSITAEYDYTMRTELSEEEKKTIGYGELHLSVDAGCELDASLYALKEYYAMGETATIAVKAPNGDYKVQLIFTTESGVQLVESKYNSFRGWYVFNVKFTGGESWAQIDILNESNLGWGDWGEFVPDRDNTVIGSADDV